MKKGIILPFLLSLSVLSCGNKAGLSGAWIDQKTYEYWKTEKPEELSATEYPVNGTNYLIITNSLIIDLTKGQETLSAPGGKWKIDSINYISKNRYTLILQSYGNPSETGSVVACMTDNGGLFFLKGQMPKGLDHEIGESFLFFGEDQVYVKCDVVK